MGRRLLLLAIGTALGAHAPDAAARVITVSFAFDVSVQRCQEPQGQPRSCDVVSSGPREILRDVETTDAAPVPFEEEFDFRHSPVEAGARVRGSFAWVRGEGLCLEGLEANLRDLADGGPASSSSQVITRAAARACVTDATGVIPVFVSGAFRLDDAKDTLLGVSVVGELARHRGPSSPRGALHRGGRGASVVPTGRLGAPVAPPSRSTK